MNIYLQKVEKMQDAFDSYYEATYRNGIDSLMFEFPIRNGEDVINIPSILQIPVTISDCERLGMQHK